MHSEYLTTPFLCKQFCKLNWLFVVSSDESYDLFLNIFSGERSSHVYSEHLDSSTPLPHDYSPGNSANPVLQRVLNCVY